ncbi:hypothetical protein CDL12_28359 [Handroanthus impetiginosus]|uniref:NAC domain-containing protein n=1 Tax=Handroanthus impetiginosus TaxID=429701 RepID=A0A2G9G1F4_9LAMI|nr:hypothetical protein CDL12_28359 [Handroanthus impetiginosus]
MATTRKDSDQESLCWYDDQVSFMPEFDPPRRIPPPFPSYHHNYNCKQELELQYSFPNDHGFLQLPNLESPKVQQSTSSIVPYGNNLQEDQNMQENDQVTDWRVLDKFVASQLSQDIDGNNPDEASESMRINGSSSSTTNSQVDMWK